MRPLVSVVVTVLLAVGLLLTTMGIADTSVRSIGPPTAASDISVTQVGFNAAPAHFDIADSNLDLGTCFGLATLSMATQSLSPPAGVSAFSSKGLDANGNSKFIAGSYNVPAITTASSATVAMASGLGRGLFVYNFTAPKLNAKLAGPTTNTNPMAGVSALSSVNCASTIATSPPLSTVTVTVDVPIGNTSSAASNRTYTGSSVSPRFVLKE